MQGRAKALVPATIVAVDHTNQLHVKRDDGVVERLWYSALLGHDNLPARELIGRRGMLKSIYCGLLLDLRERVGVKS